MPDGRGQALLRTTTHSRRIWLFPVSSITPKELVPKPRVLSLPCLSLPSEGRGGPGCAVSWGSTSRPSTLFAYCSQLLFPAHWVSSGYAPTAQSCFRRQQEEKRNEIQPLSHSKHKQFAVPPTPQRSSLFEPCPMQCKSPVPLLARGSTAPK